MGESQHFCLRWHNHHDSLVSLFSSLLESNTFVDCTLAADGKQIGVHKMVLSACSPYFKELLLKHSQTHPIIILNNIEFPEVSSLVEFMYRGEVGVAEDRMEEFMKAAKSLHITGFFENDQVQNSLTEVSNDDANDVKDIDENASHYNSQTEGSRLSDVEPQKSDPTEVYSIDSLSSEDSKFLFNDPFLKPDYYGIPLPSSSKRFYQTTGHEMRFPPPSMDNKNIPSHFVSSPSSNWGWPPDSEVTFKCDSCTKSYRSKTSLNLHKRWECGKEPKFACPYCDKKCHQKGNLKVHIISRHRERLENQMQSS